MPNIQLKNIKTAGGDETLRFTASLYLDTSDRRVAVVSNAGTGGGHQYDFFDGTQREFYSIVDRIIANPLDPSNPLHRTISDFLHYIQQTIPSFGQKDLDADIIIDCAIELEQFQRQCKTHTVFRLATDPRTTLRSIKRVFTPEVKSLLTSTYGADIVIINEFFSLN